VDTDLGRRQALGFAVLAFTVGPAWLLSAGEEAPQIVRDTATTVASVVDSARPAPRVATPPDQMRAIQTHIREVAERHGVPPRLVVAIIEAESDFNPRAVSRKGARGLMQLMPETASSLRVSDSFDPYENIEGGVRHLRRLMDRFDGDLPLVLAAYNAGEQAVAVHGGIPPYRETRRYVARIMRRLAREAQLDEARKVRGRQPAGAGPRWRGGERA